MVSKQCQQTFSDAAQYPRKMKIFFLYIQFSFQ